MTYLSAFEHIYFVSFKPKKGVRLLLYSHTHILSTYLSLFLSISLSFSLSLFLTLSLYFSVLSALSHVSVCMSFSLFFSYYLCPSFSISLPLFFSFASTAYSFVGKTKITNLTWKVKIAISIYGELGQSAKGKFSSYLWLKPTQEEPNYVAFSFSTTLYFLCNETAMFTNHTCDLKHSLA